MLSCYVRLRHLRSPEGGAAALVSALRPTLRDRLGLRVEADRVRSVLVEVAEAALLPAPEGVGRDRPRNRHIDPDHSRVHPPGEFAGRVAVAREDRGTVAV